MQTTTITRRTAPAGAAALPLAGIGADVQAVEHLADADDPAVRAFHVWRDAWLAHVAWFNGRADWAYDDPEKNRLRDAEWNAWKTLAETVATTPAGWLGQIALALDTFGDMNAGGKFGDPDSYHFGEWKDDIDGKLLKSMLIGAQRLA